MFLAVPIARSPVLAFSRSLCLTVGLCPLFVGNLISINVSATQSDEGLRLELPVNGNLRVENLRGGVIAELWNEDYVSLSAITDSGQESRSPAVVQRSDSLVSVRLARGAATATRINLRLKMPARAHAAIFTGDSSVEVRGLPAALLI